MPSKNPVITVTTQPEDGAVQVEVAIPLRPRRRKTSPDARVAHAMESPGPPRIPRITRLMALAIKFQDMVDRGEVRDYADLARLGYVTRARITQIMNLLNLAPNIQEEILLRQGTSHPIEERRLRCVTSEVCWQKQRRLWDRIKSDQIERRERRVSIAACQGASHEPLADAGGAEHKIFRAEGPGPSPGCRLQDQVNPARSSFYLDDR